MIQETKSKEEIVSIIIELLYLKFCSLGSFDYPKLIDERIKFWENKRDSFATQFKEGEGKSDFQVTQVHLDIIKKNEEDFVTSDKHDLGVYENYVAATTAPIEHPFDDPFNK